MPYGEYSCRLLAHSMMFADSSVYSPAPYGGRFLMNFFFRHSPQGAGLLLVTRAGLLKTQPPGSGRRQMLHFSYFFDRAIKGLDSHRRRGCGFVDYRRAYGAVGRLWVRGGQAVDQVWAAMLSAAYPRAVHGLSTGCPRRNAGYP